MPPNRQTAGVIIVVGVIIIVVGVIIVATRHGEPREWQGMFVVVVVVVVVVGIVVLGRRREHDQCVRHAVKNNTQFNKQAN